MSTAMAGRKSRCEIRQQRVGVQQPAGGEPAPMAARRPYFDDPGSSVYGASQQDNPYDASDWSLLDGTREAPGSSKHGRTFGVPPRPDGRVAGLTTHDVRFAVRPARIIIDEMHMIKHGVLEDAQQGSATRPGPPPCIVPPPLHRRPVRDPD